jgi:F-type H+-transporting ATPase subunit epsilon
MPNSRMQLKILTPSKVFCDLDHILRIVAESRSGSLGILPHRLDCAAALTAGVLTYAADEGKDIYVAIDEGVLVKVGTQVLISVRRAIGGADLGQLRKAVDTDFLKLNAQEKTVRTAVAKLESSLIRRFAEFHHE